MTSIWSRNRQAYLRQKKKKEKSLLVLFEVTLQTYQAVIVKRMTSIWNRQAYLHQKKKKKSLLVLFEATLQTYQAVIVKRMTSIWSRNRQALFPEVVSKVAPLFPGHGFFSNKRVR